MYSNSRFQPRKLSPPQTRRLHKTAPPRSPYESNHGRDGNIYFYVYVRAQDNDGRKIFDGPHFSYEEAYNWAMAHIPEKPFEVTESPYKDPARAKRMQRHTILTEEGDAKLDDVMKRFTGKY